MNGTLTVYGGTVNATGGTRIWQVGYTTNEGYDYDEYSGGGAGIGGGVQHGGGTVVIYGGTVNAQAGSGAGIGAGAIFGARVDRDNEKGANVTILGGYVKATPRYVSVISYTNMLLGITVDYPAFICYKDSISDMIY